MASPKLGSPSRFARNKRSDMKSIDKATTKVENPIHPEGIFYVDAFRSPVKEQVMPTLVEEHEPFVEQIDVDPRVEEKNPTEAQNHTQQLGLGEPQHKNGEDDERIESNKL
jgi:hypothetical protein